MMTYPAVLRSLLGLLVVTSTFSSASAAETTFRVTGKYLEFPVRNEAKRQTLRLLVEGNSVRLFQAEPALDGQGDWMASVNVEAWKGKNMILKMEGEADASSFFASLRQSDVLPNPVDLYCEALRPQYHFSARNGRLNDPNGLVWFNGRYHLFFQFAPYSYGSGMKHWGHATSTDLVHWTQQEIAIHPDDRGAVASGSAVVDQANTSGFGKDGQPPLILNYTMAGDRRVQAIAWSLDGQTFTLPDGPPALAQVTPKNRDPKVFWHEPTERWVMVLYLGGRHETLKDTDGRGLPVARVGFFTSPDLRNYTPVSVFDGGLGKDRFLHECPDLFPIRAKEDPSVEKWVLTGGNGEYLLGNFDGKTFQPEGPRQAMFAGNRYAGQVFSNEPKDRVVQMGWMIGPTFPGMPFNQSMALPTELALRQVDGAWKLASTPVPELASLRRESYSIRNTTVRGQVDLSGDRTWELFEMDITLVPGSAKTVTIAVGAQKILFDVASSTLSCGKFSGLAPLVNGQLALRVFADRTILEIFTADGLLYLPIGGLAPDPAPKISVSAEGGEARIDTVTIYRLASIWEAPTPSTR